MLFAQKNGIKAAERSTGKSRPTTLSRPLQLGPAARLGARFMPVEGVVFAAPFGLPNSKRRRRCCGWCGEIRSAAPISTKLIAA